MRYPEKKKSHCGTLDEEHSEFGRPHYSEIIIFSKRCYVMAFSILRINRPCRLLLWKKSDLQKLKLLQMDILTARTCSGHSPQVNWASILHSESIPKSNTDFLLEIRVEYSSGRCGNHRSVFSFAAVDHFLRIVAPSQSCGRVLLNKNE